MSSSVGIAAKRRRPQADKYLAKQRGTDSDAHAGASGSAAADKSAGGGGGKAGGAGGKGKKPAAPLRKGYNEVALEAEDRKRYRQEYQDELEAGGGRRRRGRDDDGDEEDEERAAAAAAAAAPPPTAANSAFAAAVSKIMARNVTADTALLAKRHTAAEKLAEKEAVEEKTAKARSRERKLARRAHMALPQSANPEFERQLRKVATKGGEWGALVYTSQSVEAALARRDGC